MLDRKGVIVGAGLRFAIVFSVGKSKTPLLILLQVQKPIFFSLDLL